jgi:pSer/pThr/pTyr-binding forkhead associated (FHA) protein
MKTCPSCHEEENDDDERFCASCGFELNKSNAPPPAENIEQTSNQETDELETENESDVNVTTTTDTSGKLIFPDKNAFTIDNSQRLVGRADLKAYTNEDPNLISRSHFTIYKENEKFFIKDGVTNVQNKPSENNTSVNDEKLTKDERELQNGDVILVSDVKIVFEV